MPPLSGPSRHYVDEIEEDSHMMEPMDEDEALSRAIAASMSQPADTT
jgi:hypothetical protein